MKSPLNRGGLRFYLVAIGLVVGTGICRATTPRTILAGLPPLILGVGLHTWAKGCLRQNRVVARIGPYRFVRHPFYLANALIDAGLAIMSGWWPLAAALPVWWLAIYIPVIRGEERHLAEKFPEEYPDYRHRVPCLIPWRRPLPYPGDGFRWSNPNIAGGEELPRAARILAYPLLFFVAQGLIGAGNLAWFDNGWNLTALTGLMSLDALAWELHRHQRQRLAILPRAFEHPIFRAVLGAGVLLMSMYVAEPRTSYKDVMPICGAAIFLLSIPVFARRPLRAMLAELLALLGAIAAGGLTWLAPLLAVAYLAWMMDARLTSTAPRNDETVASTPLLRWPYLYAFLATPSAAVIGIKLVGGMLRYYVGGV